MATIGETSVLSSWTQNDIDLQYAYRFVLPEDGQFTSMSLHTLLNAGENFRLCIYSDAAGPVPNNLLAQTAEGVSVVDDWVTVSLIGSPVRISAQTIWLAVHIGPTAGAPLLRWAAETPGGTSQGANPDTYADGPEDPWSGGSAGVLRSSLYAAFTPTTLPPPAAAFGPQIYAVPPKVVGY